jgi:hypothetical protein
MLEFCYHQLRLLVGSLCLEQLILILDFEKLLMQGIDLLPQLVILRP